MNVEIAERLAARRKQAGLSQEALAEKLGVSRQAVSKWERSESSPDTDNLIALAKLYGVSLDELLYVDDAIADDVAFEQITKQLHKLISVHKITDLTDEGAIERELALFKVSAPPERRSEVIEIANIFRAKIVDVGRATLTVEATGEDAKLTGLEDLFRAYGIKEIVRTGKIALSRSSRD